MRLNTLLGGLAGTRLTILSSSTIGEVVRCRCSPVDV
jgi:hypothetical protein